MRMTWGRGRIPIYLAASGPRMLELAGEIADGVIINTGLAPDIVRDSIARVRTGAEEAGRRLEDVDLWWLPGRERAKTSGRRPSTRWR